MLYRPITQVIAVIYVIAAVAIGGYAVWAAVDTFGARDDADGLTRAQFPFSVFMLAVSAATILLVIGSGIASRKRRPAARALWVLGAIAAFIPVLLASSVAIAWLHGPPLLSLGAVAGVTAMAGLIALRSPWWPVDSEAA
ncbi:hypothetical protein [Nocardioides conyzicola]|uniref:Integral membrane protein n=1 Tax=Nocardioides conyzicola TaxID=1651781 RepID=A0ABP8XX25_9ACTN